MAITAQTHLSIQAIAAIAVLSLIVYKVSSIIYSAFFHPLRKIPGPWWAAGSRIPYAYNTLRGTAPRYLLSLHKQYGPIVRFSPNEISVTNGEQAWQEIYGFRTGKFKNTESFQKDLVWYAPPVNGVPNLVLAPEGAHGRQRRILSHAFSDRSLRNQEWLLQKYANLLVARIRDTDIKQNKVSDLHLWYTWTTFDVIADLTFGESFHCLEEATTQTYVDYLITSIGAFPVSYCMRYWPFLQRLYKLLVGVPKSIRGRHDFYDFVYKQVKKRIDNADSHERHDFMTDILVKLDEEKQQGNEILTEKEIVSNASLFLGAGTETSATVLQGASFFVLRNPAVYAKLRQEIRSRFASSDEITIESVNSLPYTIAVLSETMRIFPPIPAGFPRKVPQEGAMVSGFYIPGNCNASISMSQYPSNHDPANFKNPEKFAPERWMGDLEYENDNRATFNPFSFGPRNCIGKNLAYAEMRLLFAKMFYTFDMELEPGMEDWIERCTVTATWTKPPLLAKLTPVQGA